MNLYKSSHLENALFLLGRPAYWPEIWRRLKIHSGNRLLPPAMGRSAEVASRWAQSVSLRYDVLGGFLQSPVSGGLEAEFPREMEEARRREIEFPTQQGWGGSAELIYQVCEAVEAKCVVETGVAHGFSTLAMLLSVTKRGGHVYSVDMPAVMLKDASEVGAVVPARLRASWTLFRYPDSVGLSKALAQVDCLDFCHYDSDKSYEGRSLCYPLLWKKLRSGGIFMSDDVADNTAFRDFSEELGLTPLVLQGDGAGKSGARYVGLLRKP